MAKKLKTVTAAYSGLDTKLDRRLKTVAGRWFDDSGFLFRGLLRNLHWNCDTESAAKKLKTKLRKVKHKGLVIELN